MMRKKNPLKTLLLMFFICLFSVVNVYGGVAEDIIAHHKLDMDNVKDRRTLTWLIQHDYPKSIKRKINFKWYFLVYSYHDMHEKNDFVVNTKERGNIAAYLNDELNFFVIKLDNGMAIANSNGLDGYYVPISYIRMNAISNEPLKVKDNVWLALDYKPKDISHYYHIKDGLVYEGDTNQYFKQ